MATYPTMHPDKVISFGKGDAFLAAMATDGRADLTEINLDECDAVSDSGLASLIQKFVQLQPDKIISKQKGDNFLAVVAQRRSGLTHIDLTDCEAVSDQGLALLIEGCPNLEPDEIVSNVKSDAFCAALTQYRPRLQHLDLREQLGPLTRVKLGWKTPCQGKIVLEQNDGYAKAVMSGAYGVLGHPAEAGSGVHTFEFTNEQMTSSGVGFGTDTTDLSRGLSSSRPKFAWYIWPSGDLYGYCATRSKVSHRVTRFTKGAKVTFVLDRTDKTKTSLKVSINDKEVKSFPSLETLGLPPNTTLCPYAYVGRKDDKVGLIHDSVARRQFAVGDAGLAALVKGCPQLLPDKLLSVEKGDAFAAAVAKQVGSCDNGGHTCKAGFLDRQPLIDHRLTTCAHDSASRLDQHRFARVRSNGQRASAFGRELLEAPPGSVAVLRERRLVLCSTCKTPSWVNHDRPAKLCGCDRRKLKCFVGPLPSLDPY